MAYLKRKRMTYKKKATKKPYRKKTVKKTSFAKKVRRIVLRASEPKRAPISWNKVELFHNVFSTTQNMFINSAATMPTVGGTQQGQRIGDQINVSGWKVKCLFGQKADRPNVTWRIVCYSVPKGQSIAYGDIFKNITGNVLLDEHNTDTTKILYEKYLRPSPSLDGNSTAKEYTFCHRCFIPHRKTYKFGPTEGGQSHNQNDIYFAAIVYDAFGSAITDNIGYMQIFTEMQYKDP